MGEPAGTSILRKRSRLHPHLHRTHLHCAQAQVCPDGVRKLTICPFGTNRVHTCPGCKRRGVSGTLHGSRLARWFTIVIFRVPSGVCYYKKVEVTPSAFYCAADTDTLQMIFPTSSATRSAPVLSRATPTGRPIASPFSLMNPVRTTTGSPDGMPSVNGTKITW